MVCLNSVLCVHYARVIPPIMHQKSPSPFENQAHTCKTLGIVTTPKSIASTRNIIHARARVAQYSVLYVISCSRPRPAPSGAGHGREYENMSSLASHVKYHAF